MVMIETINHELVDIALSRVSGSDFEKFANAFLASVIGERFIPLGGVSDGGADASEESIYKAENSEDFFQASIQEKYISKITKTISRLKEVGRNPGTLYYLTSKKIKMLDRSAHDLSHTTGVHIRLRDASYFVAHINDTPGTIQAYNTYLSHYTDFLKRVGAGLQVEMPPDIKSPEIYIFLRQEVDRTGGKEPLNVTLSDSIIAWALEGTDPDQGVFLTEEEVMLKAKSLMVNGISDLEKTIKRRLQVLSRKDNPAGFRIRFYKKEQKYCLPDDQRKIFQKENLEDLNLRNQVLEQFKAKLERHLKDFGNSSLSIEKLASTCLRCIEDAFTEIGIEYSSFISGNNESKPPPLLVDFIDKYIRKDFSASVYSQAHEAVVQCLRGAIYQSTNEERQFLDRLNRTYILLLTLRSDLKVTSYFNDVASNLSLFVGADIFIRALSEKYLPEASQISRRMLRIVRDFGAQLILTGPTLEEIVAHFHATDLEFKNYYAGAEPFINREIAFQSDRILIRAYFRSKYDENLSYRPGTWQSFVNQFCDPEALRRAQTKAMEDLKKYLLTQFGCSFLEKQSLLECVDAQELKALTREIMEIKNGNEILAENDALSILGVYGERVKNGEHKDRSPFGFKTWWLTNEFNVITKTRSLVAQRGARYIIRPDFLLNFIALAPSAASIRALHKNIFPSVVGLSLGRRVDPYVLHETLKDLAELKGMDQGRVVAKIAEMTDKLKSDLRKKYHY